MIMRMVLIFEGKSWNRLQGCRENLPMMRTQSGSDRDSA